MYVCDHPMTQINSLDLLWSNCISQIKSQGKRQKEKDRINIDAQPDWSCPACHDLTLDEIVVWSHASRLLEVTWSPTWEPKELMHSWASFQQMIQIYEAKQIAPPLDEGLDNLERQNFCTSINYSTWKSTQDKKIRSKACFDMQPTIPHVDITPTGHYKVWIRTVDLVRLKDDIAQNKLPLINATHKASLPELYEARAACIYNPDGKCIGMMTPERFRLLRERFHEAQKNGSHKVMSSPVQCLASEIAGLLQGHQARLKTPKASQRTQ